MHTRTRVICSYICLVQLCILCIYVNRVLISDELQQWRLQLRDAQRRSLEHYILKKNEDEDMAFLNLSNIHIELLMHRSIDHYKRLETRTRYGNLDLMRELEAYPNVYVRDLFKAERSEMTTPVRSLVTGQRGIGKIVMCLHIVDLWLKGELLPNDIHQVFLIRLRDLASNNTCSIEDLFFKYQSCTKPSAEAISEFFKQLFAEPEKTLLILDVWNEIKAETMEIRRVYEYNEQVDMPKLVASIIKGSHIPSVRVIVTSRPGDVTNSYTYDKRVEIYGFTRTAISEYIVIYSAEDHELQIAIKNYIGTYAKIESLCYIPVQLNMVCRIVKDKTHDKNNPELPETLTELFVAAVQNILIYFHPKFKHQHVNEMVNVIAKLKNCVLNRALIARSGMKDSPIKVTFTKKDIHNLQLDNVTTKCGLMTESRKSIIVMFKPTVIPVFYFQHLTIQEFLASVAIITDVSQVADMMDSASGRQLDVMLVFLAGLLGNKRTHAFIESLHALPMPNNTAHLDELIKLVVDRE